MLLKANHSDNKILFNKKIITIKKGEFITSLNILSKESELSVRQIRTFLSNLESENMLKRQTTNKATKITICKYDSYQENQQAKRQAKRQADDKQTTTNNNNKNEKKEQVFESIALNELWEKWKKYRKEIKKPVTATSSQQQIKKLKKIPPTEAIEMIEQSIENGWVGLFPLKRDRGVELIDEEKKIKYLQDNSQVFNER
jgi:hypothetical protein